MIIVGANNRNTRVVYAEEIDGQFYLSPFPEVRNGRRPVARYDSKEELENHVTSRGCGVQWLTN